MPIAPPKPRIEADEPPEAWIPADEEPPPFEPGDDDGDDDGDEGPWITVATFWQAAPAHVARLRLEAEGVPCVILDENIVAMNWFLANVTGGIKLQVPRSWLNTARKLLAKTGTPDVPSVPEPIFDGQTRCPRCGSDRLHVERFSRRLAFLFILLVGAPLPIFRRQKRCEDCNFAWKAGEQDVASGREEAEES